jgi:hypothetical protein
VTVPRADAAPPVNGAEMLTELADYLGKYIAFPSPEARDAVALWVVHTHALAAFDSTPRLAMLSPEKGSGKTRVLELIGVLGHRPRHTSSLTAAALFRLVEMEQPTLLIDESDTFFGPGAQQHEELRGLLNAGHRRGAVAYRCTGQKGDQVKEFPAFAAVALAGIGDLPDTILDRAVLVKMRRRAPDETVLPFRQREAELTAGELRGKVEEWAAQAGDQLEAARPEMPEGLVDRPADVWEPLLAIADAAGSDWPTRGRSAAVKLNGERQDADPSWGVRLLADVRSILEPQPEEGQPDPEPLASLKTADLVEKLVAIEESPWGDLRGKPLDARGLARRLKPYGIRPKQLRIAGLKERGYERADFIDAWNRYLPSPPEKTGTSGTPGTSSSEGRTGNERRTACDPVHEPDPAQEFEFAVPPVPDVPVPGQGEAHCPACGHPLTVPDPWDGGLVLCRHCRAAGRANHVQPVFLQEVTS